jgi:Zn-finger nucleic acid-binding protein
VELEGGYSVTLAGKAERAVRKAASAAKRAWAACLRKIFEVDLVRCDKCGGGMKLAAVILDDRELDRILAHQGWPTEFPRTKASRAPPGSAERGDEDSQADPRDWEGRQDFPSEWPA